MTIVNATVGDSFACISSDTLVLSADGAPIGYASKVAAIPHLPALIGGTGHWNAVRDFEVLVRHTSSVDVEAVLAQAPITCRAIAAAYPGQRFRVTIAAMLPDGRAIARAFDSVDDFAPVEIARAHGYVPTPSFDAPDYDALAAGSGPALDGVDVETFHRNLAMAQLWSWRAGKVAPGECESPFAIGGTLLFHHLDASGISIKKIATFPEVQP